MTINIKKNKIARILFICTTLITYTWLIHWTTVKIRNNYEGTNLENAPQERKHFYKMTVEDDLEIETNNYRSFLKRQENYLKCKRNLSISSKRWLIARYSPNIETAWTYENQLLDDSIYDWWLSLQNSQDQYTPKILQQLFEIGVINIDPNQKSSSKCNRCAIVGNSGNLLNSHFGKVRLNYAKFDMAALIKKIIYIKI